MKLIFRQTGIMFTLACIMLLFTCSTDRKKGRDVISPSRPNIIIILADDMGFSDLGCYGSEISTPNIDQLAADGLRYTQFYNAGRCCPTRASLLTGLYAHQTGMGWMTAADLDHPGYTGDLNNRCLTIGEVMKEAGYSTYLVGK